VCVGGRGRGQRLVLEVLLGLFVRARQGFWQGLLWVSGMEQGWRVMVAFQVRGARWGGWVSGKGWVCCCAPHPFLLSRPSSQPRATLFARTAPVRLNTAPHSIPPPPPCMRHPHPACPSSSFPPDTHPSHGRPCRGSAMVQLSVLLCCIPLCLENAMMQAHITRVSDGGDQAGDTGVCSGVVGPTFTQPKRLLLLGCNPRVAGLFDLDACTVLLARWGFWGWGEGVCPPVVSVLLTLCLLRPCPPSPTPHPPIHSPGGTG
jgi:hypothetical protein